MGSRPAAWREVDTADPETGKGAGRVRTDETTAAETATGDGPLDGWCDDSEFEGTLALLGDGVL